MSQRHADPLLEAARDCVLAVGVRRTTFSDIARRAGVSRMTLYRRFPDLEALLSALMTHEFGRLVDAAREGAGGGTQRERVVAFALNGTQALAADPLFQRLLDVDPELLLPYVTRRVGGMQRMILDALAEELAVKDGSIREDAHPAAIELITRGFVLASRGELEPGLDPWTEMGRAIDGYLRA